VLIGWAGRLRKDVIVERGWGSGSLYSSPYMDDFSGVRRIVPCTNLNIDDILNLESSRDLPDKLQISFQAEREPQRSSNLGAKTFLNTNLQSAEAIA